MVQRTIDTQTLMQSGYAIGGILAASLAIPLIPAIGWHVMYLIGAAPLGLFTGGYRPATVLFWIATFCALLLVYGLNTWLPQIMRQAGYPLGSALSFLLVFNLGPIVGSLVGGRVADRVGAKRVIVVAFAFAAVSVAALSLEPSMMLIYLLLALGGYGTIGTQNLINSYYPGPVRATGIGWSLGVGRLGGVLGPFAGGLVLASSLGLDWNFYLFGAIALIGALIIAFVPRSPATGPAVTADPAKATPPGRGGLTSPTRQADHRPSARRNPGGRTTRPYDATMSLRHALLGVLAARPMSGYDLSQFFDSSTGWVWTWSGPPRTARSTRCSRKCRPRESSKARTRSAGRN